MRRAVVLVLVLALSACNSPLLPETPAGMVGEVVSIRLDADSDHLVHVKTIPADECGIVFRLDDDSVVVDSKGGTSRSVNRDALETGAHVSVWFGWVDTSCPGQSYAVAMELLP